MLLADSCQQIALNSDEVKSISMVNKCPGVGCTNRRIKEVTEINRLPTEEICQWLLLIDMKRVSG